jgi:hypothetical protein
VVVKSVWKVNLKSGEWHLDPDYPKDLEEARSHFGCVVKSGIIYLFGGNNEDAKYSRLANFLVTINLDFYEIPVHYHPVKSTTQKVIAGIPLVQWMGQG